MASLVERGRRLLQNYVWWATVLLVVVAFGVGAVVSSVVGGQAHDDALANAQRTATVLGRSAFFVDLLPTPHPFTAAQLKDLDGNVAALRTSEPVTSVTVWDRQDRILYSYDHRLIGKRLPAPPDVVKALAGQSSTFIEHGADDLSDLTAVTRVASTLPVRAKSSDRPVGAFSVSTPYAPVAADINSRTTRLRVIIGAALLIIYLLALGPTIRLGRRLRAQRDPERRRLLADLERAIDRGQLRLHYQPIVRCASGQLSHVEALVRWVHPQRGFVGPDEFIDAAEGTRVMWPLSIGIFELALVQTAAWHAKGLDISVAVNISASTLLDPRLPGELARLLGKHQLPPRALQIEITEGAIMDDPAAAAAQLGRIRELGVESIALDDFGTGYSSLSRLYELSLDTLKIDRSFIIGLTGDGNGDGDGQGLVRSIIDLAHDLGLHVVAEGVEDAQTAATLAYWGCDHIQGYWLTRPLPPADLERWLTERDIEEITALADAARHDEEKRAHRRAARQESYYRAAFEQALDAIVFIDDSRHHVEANPAACALLGLTRQELLTKTMDDFLPADTRADMDRQWGQFLEDGEARGDWTLQLPDGRTRRIEYHRKADFVRGHHISILREKDSTAP